MRENLIIAALADLRGKFRLDLFKSLGSVPGLAGQVGHTLELVDLVQRADTPVSDLAYGEKRRLEIGLALATSPSHPSKKKWRGMPIKAPLIFGSSWLR